MLGEAPLDVIQYLFMSALLGSRNSKLMLTVLSRLCHAHVPAPQSSGLLGNDSCEAAYASERSSKATYQAIALAKLKGACFDQSLDYPHAPTSTEVLSEKTPYAVLLLKRRDDSVVSDAESRSQPIPAWKELDVISKTPRPSNGGSCTF